MISGFQVECLSPSPPLAFGGVDLVSRSRHRHRRCRSCCSRQGVNSGWVVWIVLLGLFRFLVAGLCGLCCWVVLISGASILLLGLFFWFSAGGLCGLCCWVCSISGCWIVWIVLLGCVDFGCVDLVAGFVFLVFYRWVVWIVLLGLFDSRLLDCVDCVARLC